MMEGKQRRRFVYLVSGGLASTVIDSQVITVLQRMAERGIVFDLFIYQVRPHEGERAAASRRLAEVRRLLPGKVRLWTWPNVQFLVRRTIDVTESTEKPAQPRATGSLERILGAVRIEALKWRGLVMQAVIVACVARSIWRREVIVLHARGGTFDVAMGLKRWYSGFRVLADFRGDAPAEYLYNAARHGLSLDDAKVRREHTLLRELDGRVLVGADGVHCVSQALKSHLEGEHQVRRARIRVVPGLADEGKFYFDEEARKRVRQDLGLEGKSVFIYAGSMLAWQAPHALLRVWKHLSGRLASVQLVLLTPEEDRARILARRAGLSEGRGLIICSAHHDDVRGYLSAADVGLLLRESHPLNHVASPTKFAEYLLCGLAVLISRGIGDSAEIVTGDGLGVILDSDTNLAEVERKAVTAIQIADDGRRKERARRAAEKLGLHTRFDSWVALYKQL